MSKEPEKSVEFHGQYHRIRFEIDCARQTLYTALEDRHEDIKKLMESAFSKAMPFIETAIDAKVQWALERAIEKAIQAAADDAVEKLADRISESVQEDIKLVVEKRLRKGQ